MTIEKYQELTGLTIPSSRTAFVTAQIGRTRRILETLLGYSLNKQKAGENHYDELGKTDTDYDIPDDVADLEAADAVIGSYRLFNYHEDDIFLAIDPATQINAVKLVYVRGGATPNGITVKTFDLDEYRVVIDKDGNTKFLERLAECWFRCGCDPEYHAQLAVDAYWLNEDCLPMELQYLWADMVTYYSDDKKDVQAETLGPHSYRKYDRKAPETESATMAILRQYAGPLGSIQRTITL